MKFNVNNMVITDSFMILTGEVLFLTHGVFLTGCIEKLDYSDWGFHILYYNDIP